MEEGEDQMHEEKEAEVLGEDGLIECRATTCENFFRRSTIKRDRDRRLQVARHLEVLSW
jgi:hypothetical protein